MRNKLLLILALSVSLSSCEKKDPGPVSSTPPGTSTSYSGMLVINEGNFQSGNATLDFYNPDSQTLTSNVYEGVNGSSIGDVLHSATRIDSLIYLVVNNSGKILVISQKTLKLKRTITGFNSPRQILDIGSNKALVSDLYANQLYIVNLNTGNISGTLPVNGWTESMVAIGSKAYISNKGENTILELDKAGLVFTDTIPVTVEAHSMSYDKNQKLWVVCSGDATNNGTIYRINPGTGVEQSYVFTDINKRPSHIRMNAKRDGFVFLENDLYQMSITDNTLPGSPFITSTGQLFYGINQGITGDFYLADAIDYVQKGNIYRYDINATPIDTFNSGIIPNGLLINP